MKGSVARLAALVWKTGKEDPRRAIHAVKVGLGLTMASLLCLLEPLYDGIGQNAIWAVMTVVVVLEFTAGATLCKGLNRGMGTVLAGLFALFIEYFAVDRPLPRAVFIGSAVFLTGTVATFMRFFPDIKKNYDYGVVVFLLTFNLILVSSYKVDNVTKMGMDRFYTIAIGCGICLSLSLVFFPAWSGDDLRKSTITRLEGLADFFRACVEEYFDDNLAPEEKTLRISSDSVDENCRKALDSKSLDETLALYASWEPRHLCRGHRSPWWQYVNLGAALRHFGYSVVALNGCLHTEIKASSSIRGLFRDECVRLAREVSQVLVDLAAAIESRRQFHTETLSRDLHLALQELNASLHSQQALLEVKSPKRQPDNQKVLRPQPSGLIINDLGFSEALPFAAFVSLLVEAVARLELVIMEAEKLGKIEHFKEYKAEDQKISVRCETPRSIAPINIPTQGAE
ncbi:hypothetical protein MLD38_015512 [Melastoma candidum]|uniref:Uncharacterized protein n=1 Tax=Melastoma candidum TaxID=119954 RepID=A0ACB9RPT5_9MYRT|nr:hypothetical protein MLD38_015512 [Melastoma candidum]